jgi:hypothetical protein
VAGWARRPAPAATTSEQATIKEIRDTLRTL